MQRYAFPVDEELFDRTYAELRDGGAEHWADPRFQRAGEIHCGRGVVERLSQREGARRSSRSAHRTACRGESSRPVWAVVRVRSAR